MTKFAPAAVRFIRKEHNYLRARSAAAARQFSADIASVKQLLDDYPAAGTEFDLLKGTPQEGIRRWVKGNYTFDYEIDRNGEAIIILVRHHAQNDPFLTYNPDDNDDFDP